MIVQLLHQFLLRMAEHIAVDGITVLFMADNDAPSHRPSSRFRTMPSPDGLRFAIGSHLPFSNTTYHNGFSISSDNPKFIKEFTFIRCSDRR